MSIGSVNTHPARASQPNPAATGTQQSADTGRTAAVTSPQSGSGSAAQAPQKPVLNTQGQITGRLLNVTA